MLTLTTGQYQTAQICLDGHVITSSANRNPEMRQKFCDQCGKKTIMNCHSCNTAIRGLYQTPGEVGSIYLKPRHCHNCGIAFPWTQGTIESAIEAVNTQDNKLSDEELNQLRSDITELTKDSSNTKLAAYSFNNLLKNVGSGVTTLVKDIITDIISDSAKKLIGL